MRRHEFVELAHGSLQFLQHGFELGFKVEHFFARGSSKLVSEESVTQGADTDGLDGVVFTLQVLEEFSTPFSTFKLAGGRFSVFFAKASPRSCSRSFTPRRRGTVSVFSW